MNRAAPWLLFASCTALLAALIYSTYYHVRFSDLVMQVMMAAWS